jgi:hypothetical protein
MGKRHLAIISAGILVIIAGILPLLPEQRFPEVRKILRLVKYQYVMGQPLVDGFPREPVDCSALKSGRTLVALAFGQSNSANFGRGRYQPRQAVYSFHGGHCYKATDPLPGATGSGGSVWSHLGDLLIQAGLFDKVVFATIGVGGSEISRWSPGGDLYPKLVSALTGMAAAGFIPTHLFWHQGEADSAISSSEEHYRTLFGKMAQGIRERGIHAPIYVALASYCYGESSRAIRQAQRDLIGPALNILPGPDTDTLAAREYRYDDCHFTELGLQRHAELWLQAIQMN